MAAVNSVLWHSWVLYSLLLSGIVFTVWSRFSQFHSVTHGLQVLRGRYNDDSDPGAISHFQALATALSNTVGLGNIGGVALAISLGGPGAVFWMWVVGVLGMSVKTAEVNLSMLYRNTDDPDNPHGGPMWVVARGLQDKGVVLAWTGKVVAALFCVAVLVATITGGNMFQAWNVSNMARSYFGVPTLVTGVLMTVVISLVIIGGIKRIGAVTGRLVPVMVTLYLLAGVYVLLVNRDGLLDALLLIFRSAFAPAEATGAFIGGTVGTAFLFGMKRAIFSSEAGQGSSPMAHCAAKTREPVREGIVAGLEPLIDTLIVCTFTALVILSSGVWNRAADVQLENLPTASEAGGSWVLPASPAPEVAEGWVLGDAVYLVVQAELNPLSGNHHHKLSGSIVAADDGSFLIEWQPFVSQAPPVLNDAGVYVTHVGAVLTAKAFDSALPGLGKWLVTIAVFMFAISTMIGASYYGEQAIVYLFGSRWTGPYKVLFCVLTLVSCFGFIKTDMQLDGLSGIGAGFMLVVNLPILWLFSIHGMRAYKDYLRRMNL